MWPSWKGIVTPPGARFVAPWIGYVAKLGLRCSPSVMTGEPVSSKRRMRVAHGAVEERLESVGRDPAVAERGHAFDQFLGSWNASDRLRG